MDMNTYFSLLTEATNPSNDQIDDALEAAFVEHDAAFVYYSTLKESFVYSPELLNAATAAARALLPCDLAAVAQIFIPLYLAYLAEHTPEEKVHALIDPRSAIGKGVILHPNCRNEGGYQVTIFDREGLIYHKIATDLQEALLFAASRRCYKPVTAAYIDQLAEQWTVRL